MPTGGTHRGGQKPRILVCNLFCSTSGQNRDPLRFCAGKSKGNPQTPQDGQQSPLPLVLSLPHQCPGHRAALHSLSPTLLIQKCHKAIKIIPIRLIYSSKSILLLTVAIRTRGEKFPNCSKKPFYNSLVTPLPRCSFLRL